MRLWLGHITWVYIHVRFEDLLNKSVFIANQIGAKGVLHHGYQWDGPKQNCQDTLAIDEHFME